MYRIIALLLLSLIFVIPVLAQEDATPVPEVVDEPTPDPMPLADEGTDDIVNILLMGSATNNPENPGLSDSMMIVSVNRTAGAVSVVSIPRDLYVYVPGFNMRKINTAYFYGEMNPDTVPEGGFALLIETIRYNLGLNIDFYARVDFNGFADVIDAVGGIDITVDCTIQDWKLKSPELDKQNADNWEMFTLEAGRYHMDSETALWYVRSRRTSSDLDRGRRQQDVLRAVWRQLRAGEWLQNLSTTWDTLSESVTTNLTLTDILGFAPMALNLETSDIEYYTFRQRHEVSNAYSPAGQAILRMNREAVAELMQNVVRPPNGSQIIQNHPTVAIVNAGGIEDMEYVAADRLELEGFRTIIIDEPSQFRQYNHIIDYTGATKGSRLPLLQDVLRVTAEGVEITPDPSREYDFKIYIGSQYRFWSCTRDVIQPTPTPETTTELGT